MSHAFLVSARVGEGHAAPPPTAPSHPSAAPVDATGTAVVDATGAAPAAGLPVPVAPQGTVGVVLGSAWYVAAVLGTGILLLPALAVEVAGPASVLAVGLVLVASVPLAATFAALATRHPDPGGVATYVRRALGPTAARATGYWFFFGVCVGTPVVALLGAEYVAAMVGGGRWLVYVVGAVLLVPSFVTNAVGLRLTGPVQLALTGGLVAIVVLVVAAAAPATDPAHLRPFLPHGWSGVGAAVSLYVWAFAGWEAVTHVAGEFRDPHRAALRATAVAAIVTLGVLNAYVAAFAKLGASLGRDGDLPRWLAPGGETGGVPRRALLVVGALAAAYFALAVASGGALGPFVLVHTSCRVAIYGTGVLAALRLLRRGTPGGWAAAVATLLVLVLLALAGVHLLVPAALGAVAAAVGPLRRRAAGRPSPVRGGLPEGEPGPRVG